MSLVPLRLRLPGAYRQLFANRVFRRLMPAFTLSDLGDGMTIVGVAWLAITIAPVSRQGVLAGIAVAAYTLPGALGAFLLGRWMRPLPADRLIMVDAVLRATLLGAIPLAHATGVLTPGLYVALLGASSLLHAWGKAGKYALFAPLLPDDQRLAANSVLSTSQWTSTIAGPAVAGLLASVGSPAWIFGLTAATYAVMALQTYRVPLPPPATAEIVLATADSTHKGMRVLLYRPELLGLVAVTWFFDLAFGPVEVALPLFVAVDLRAGPDLLGAYWATFGAGAVVGALCLGAARRLPLWPVILGIIAGHGLALLPFAFTNSVAPSLAGFAAAGVIYGPYSALSFTFFQDRTPAANLTMVLAARTAILTTASPLGAAIGGLLLDRTSAASLVVVCGVAMTAIAATAGLMLATRIRYQRR